MWVGPKREVGVIEDKIVSGEGDEIGWRSILIWRQNRGKETERHSFTHECVFAWIVFKSDSSANHPCKRVWPRYGGWRRSHSTLIHKFVTLWAPKGCRQSEYIFDHSVALWQEGRGGGSQGVWWQGRRQMCDRHGSYSCWQAFSSVWDGQMDGWMDGWSGMKGNVPLGFRGVRKERWTVEKWAQTDWNWNTFRHEQRKEMNGVGIFWNYSVR